MIAFLKAYKEHLPKVLIAAVLLLIFLLVPPVWKLKNGTVKVKQWHKNKGETEVEVGPNQSGWIHVEAISRHVLHAMVTAEDDQFFTHNGLVFSEIRSALMTNLRHRRYVRGGSTITQQVVKMAFLSRDKSIIRKMREAVGALLAERVLDKQKILEWYINLAEFGDSVYGIRAAAWHYFRTKPELLTIQQATHLAIVLPSPNGWSFGLRRRSLTDFGHNRFLTIITRMKRSGYITEELWLNALATGDFGRPIHGYDKVLAALAKSQPADTAVSIPESDAEIELELKDEEIENPELSTEVEGEQSQEFRPTEQPIPAPQPLMEMEEDRSQDPIDEVPSGEVPKDDELQELDIEEEL